VAVGIVRRDAFDQSVPTSSWSNKVNIVQCIVLFALYMIAFWAFSYATRMPPIVSSTSLSNFPPIADLLN